jgi:hypothetical protein
MREREREGERDRWRMDGICGNLWCVCVVAIVKEKGERTNRGEEESVLGFLPPSTNTQLFVPGHLYT